jgi:hypothetical protein
MTTTTTTTTRAKAIGLCYCDCGGETNTNSLFLPGHDKRAERYLMAVKGTQSIADELASMGFVPGSGGSLRAAALYSDPQLEECGRLNLEGGPCRTIGKGAPMQRHRRSDSRHSD